MNKHLIQASIVAKGFTLVEVVMVIILMSILSVIGTAFIVKATESYQSTQARSKIANTGRQALERMSRQLRGALPYSVRLTNSNTCIEFFPIAGGGNYISSVPDAFNGMAASATISVSPHAVEFGSANYVSIGAMSSAELYGASTVSRATLSSRTATQLTLSAAKSWQRNSINQRFYLLDSPQAFCIVSNQLRFYANQNVTGEVVTGAGYEILADSVVTTTPFALTAASENRNVNVLIDIGFAKSGESVTFKHSVMIRNVP